MCIVIAFGLRPGIARPMGISDDNGLHVFRRPVVGFAVFLLLLTMPLSLGDDDTVFPSLMDAADVEYFFTGYDVEGLHWAASNIFQRSPRSLQGGGASLDKMLVARGSGDGYTAKYKLQHDLDQAHYLVDVLQEEEPEISGYFKHEVIPIYQAVLRKIPSLEQLKRTKGEYP